MKRFTVLLLTLALTACATTHDVSLPREGFGIDGVDVGDTVRIVLLDGQTRKLSVTHVDESGLHGSDEFYFYDEMQSVSVVEMKKTSGVWWLVLSLAAVAILAEPDSGGWEGLCLRSSEGGPCLP